MLRGVRACPAVALSRRTREIVHQGVRAVDQLLGSRCPAVVEQAHASSGDLDQLDHLVQAGPDLPLRRGARRVPGEEPVLSLLESGLLTGDVPQLQVGEKLPNVESRVGQVR